MDTEREPAGSLTARRLRRLFKRCCRACEGRATHVCDERPAPAYPTVEDPGALEDAGPLAAGVQQDLEAITGRACTRDNRVRLLVDGVQSYTAMLDLVESAHQEIPFENFIFSGDDVGRAFAAGLRKGAQAGLDVRILHDPFGAFWGFHLPIGFQFHHSPARVRVYNPPLPFRRFLRTGRDHRKLVVQDRRRAVAGGLCLADIWVGNCVRHCTWAGLRRAGRGQRRVRRRR